MYRINQRGMQPSFLDNSGTIDRILETHLLAVGEQHADRGLNIVVIAHPAEIQPKASAMLDHQPLVILAPRAQVVVRIGSNPLQKGMEAFAKRNKRRHIFLVQTDELAGALRNSALDGRKRIALEGVYLHAVWSGNNFCRSDLDDFRNLVFLMSQCRFQVIYNDLQA